MLLSAPQTATLLIGSGNLTYGGWRNNAEVWRRFSTDERIDEFVWIRNYIRRIADALPLNGAIRSEVEEAFDESKHDWSLQLGESSGLVGRLPGDAVLIDLIQGQLGDASCDELTVVSPYFDPGGDALRAIAHKCGASVVKVYVPEEHSNLTPEGLASWSGISQVHSASGGPRPHSEKRPFVHAKILAFSRGDEVVVFVGSGNCSRAALLNAGAEGNAELFSYFRMPKSEFDSALMSELRVSVTPPRLSAVAPIDFNSPAPRPQIIAARVDQGVLRIAYSPPDWGVTDALVDGVDAELTGRQDGVCDLTAPATSVSVALRGEFNGQQYTTHSFWIDDEFSLSATATGRSLERKVREHASHGVWDLSVWQDLVKALCADLENVPTGRAIGTRERPEPGKEVIFSRDEAFPPRMPWPIAVTSARGAGDVDAGSSLERLMVNWFLRAEGRHVREMASRDAQSDGDDIVDAPVSVDAPKRGTPDTPRTRDVSEAGKARARRLLVRIVAAFTSESYLQHRHPADVARDIMFAAVILRMALAKGWIDRDDLVAATCSIWVPLFVAGGGGALGRWRRSNHEATDRWLGTPPVAAALFTWSLELREVPATATDVQAALILALAVARHPWIWGVGNVAAVAAEATDILQATAADFRDLQVAKRWGALTEAAEALFILEQCLRTRPLRDWLKVSHWSELPAGEMVWQGTIGYCVTQTKAVKSGEENAMCLPIETASAAARRMKPALLNPIRPLLTSTEVQKLLTEDLVRALNDLLELGTRLHQSQ